MTSKFDSVDITSNFYTFRNQVVEKFGDFYESQVDMFFERACYFANIGLIEQAIEEARFAYNLNNYQPVNYEMVYIVGFLCELYIQKENIRKAKSYCDLGLKLLDPDEKDYDYDFAKFKEMEEIIRGEEWKELR